MGYEYVLINSRHRKPHETTSSMNVQLSNPIHKALDVKVMSFSCANEFYNIQEGNNSLQFVIYPVTSLNGFGMLTPHLTTIEVSPGLYTVDELVAAITADLSEYESPIGFQIVDIAVTLLANNRVQVQCVSTEGLAPAPISYARVVLYHPFGDDFYTSVSHRLGFSRTQVVDFIPDFILDPISDRLVAVMPNGRMVDEDLLDFLVWDTEIETGQTRVSDNIGFETYPYVYLKSDALVKHATRTIKNSDGSVATAHTNVLQKIPITVSLFSWIHFFGSEEVFVHSLDGRTITSFDIGLTDHANREFSSRHFKDFSVELMFQTADGEDANIRAITALSKKGYDIRHNCARN
jgi:hypothetical protein